MRTRNLIALIAVVLVTALALVCAFAGVKIGDKQIIKPISEGLSLGLDLKGGVYVVFRADRENYGEAEFSALLDNTAEVLRKRLTNEGYTEASVSLQGTDSIRVEIPEVEDPDEVVGLIGKPAKLEFLDPNDKVIIEGKDIREVSPFYDETKDRYGVAFTLSDDAADAFEKATARLVDQPIFIMLDGEEISAPYVSEKIAGGHVSISLQDGLSRQESYEEAEQLATLIMSGALPLNLTEEDLRSISPTLGEDAMNKALVAGLIGAALILLFMAAVYRLPGLMADLALCWYILLVFVLISLLGIQLTLPGIAGILLGIGMAVDANVVIFERFREELRLGRSYESAVKAGFKNALRAIVDSNITTLIAAFVLMYFGTGSVRGFSYTLCISVVVSMFTAVFVTRFLLNRAVRLGINSKAAYTRKFSQRHSFAVVKRARLFALVPAVLVLAALIMNIAGAGIHLGIDFTGGTLVEYDVGEDFTTEQITAILREGGHKDFSVSKTAKDGETRLQIRTRLEAEEADWEGVTQGVMALLGDQKLKESDVVTNKYITQNNLDDSYRGARLFTYEGLVDSDLVQEKLEDALHENSMPFSRVHAVENDDAEEPETLIYILTQGESASGVGEITELLRQRFPEVKQLNAEYAGAVSSAQLIKNALLSMGVALVLMLIYIAIRFDLFSGLAALLGLFHDVVIMLAAMSFFGFLYQVNSPFIAALLTIVGYSINDTIIIFDRIRENKKSMRRDGTDAVVDTSVSQSLSRTVNTSVTTLITLVALFVLGTETIREFTFPLIAGMIAGTYSSNLLSGPFWAWLMNRKHGRKQPAEDSTASGDANA